MRAELLSDRALGRATLARQLLLQRAELSPLEAVERLVGLQAQVPRDPYTALWSRLDGFRPDELSRLLHERRVVRTTVMRGTIHLVTADDALLLRPLVQPVLDRELARHRDFSPLLAGVELEPVLAVAREALAEPRSGPQLRAALAERFPQHDPAALAYACRCLLPLVQVPPRGLWGLSGGVVTTTAEAWLGRPLATLPSLDDVVLRYFAAFGPASVADAATWSRLTGLRAVVDRLRPRLRAFRDERGRELVDLPDAPRPDPDTPAPPRFLPEYDNVLLSHANRGRLVAPDVRARIGRAWTNGAGSFLVDGRVCGLWRLERDGDRAILDVRHGGRLPRRAAASVAAEGRRFLRFAAADADERDVRLAPLD
ncbi:MAG TPA: winged helix DNA-binding domain-containing protein [Gaiellaceae bacterium]|nr:winged helix DNA-binding domain-containing protein [Gaiellaceae bacterium]